MPTALDAFNQVERMGCRVFPIPYGSKKPNIPNWRDAASDDPLRIGEMWLGGDHNIGTVVNDHLVILDADEHSCPGAIGRLFDLLHAHNVSTSQAMHFTTASGGLHFPLRVPYAIATKIRHWGKDVGIDIVGYGSQVIGPPSVVTYPDGRSGTYGVVNDGLIIPDCPQSLLDNLVRYEDRKHRVETTDIQELDNIADVIGFKAVIAGTPAAIEGQGGNDRTYKLACEGRDSGLSEDTVLRCILTSEWNQRQCVPPWQFVELSELVANAFRYGRSSQGSKSVASLFQGAAVPPPPVAANGHSLPAGLLPPPMNPAGAPEPYQPLGRLRISEAKLDRPWLVHDLLMRGKLSAVAAQGGTGKGLLIAAIAVRLVVGGEFGPWHFKGGNRVVILSYEEDHEMLSHRILAQIEHYRLDKNTVLDNIILLDTENGDLTLTTAMRYGATINKEAVEGTINELIDMRADVLLADPLQFMGDGDMNMSHIAKQLMKSLIHIAVKANIAILYTHHVAKGDKTNDLRGSGSIRDLTKVVYGMERNEDFLGHNVVNLSMGKTNLDKFQFKTTLVEIISHQLTPTLSTGLMIDSQYAVQVVSKDRQELRDTVAEMLSNGTECVDGALPTTVIKKWLMERHGITESPANNKIKAEFEENVAVRMSDGTYVTRKKRANSAQWVFVYSDDAELTINNQRFNRLPGDDNIEDLF